MEIHIQFIKILVDLVLVEIADLSQDVQIDGQDLIQYLLGILSGAEVGQITVENDEIGGLRVRDVPNFSGRHMNVAECYDSQKILHCYLMFPVILADGLDRG